MLQENLKLRRLQLKACSLDKILEIVRGAILRLCTCKEAQGVEDGLANDMRVWNESPIPF